MYRTTLCLSLVTFGLALVNGQLNTGGQTQPTKPSLLTLEQQQELLEQLAQLQRQTQQLLAAQQSLAAVAAAAGVSAPQAGTHSTQSTPQHLHHHQRQSSSSVQPQTTQPTLPPSHNLNTQPPQRVSNKPVLTNQNNPTVTTVVEDPNTLTNQQTPPSLPQGPAINWGKCPELEPSEQEKLAKASVITKCLENTPLPGNITRESVEQHREQIAACALRAEGWFTNAGGYDFSKAEKEIKNKRLQKDLESQVLSYHTQCKSESEEKYPTSNSSIIAQIQLYQACMDYFISDVCGIEVNDSDLSV